MRSPGENLLQPVECRCGDAARAQVLRILRRTAVSASVKAAVGFVQIRMRDSLRRP